MVRRRRRKKPSRSRVTRVARKRRGKRSIRRGFKHTDATKLKIASATVSNISSGKIKATSKLERVVRKQLWELNIQFIYQYPLADPDTGLYVAAIDFYLPKQNIALEVNGTYWHADPRFYDRACLTPAQANTFKRYEKKRKHLVRSGIELREVWEADVKENPLQAVKSALGI